MKRLLVLLIAMIPALAAARAADPDPSRWDRVLGEARGQVVYWNAWGGSQSVNAFIAWAGSQLEGRHGVKVVHVKVDDTAHAVAKVVTEKAAGRDEGGSVDLIWINGENFAAMKRQGLLFSPGWADRLPNWRHVDVEGKPTVLRDFTVPVEGLESPWGMAKLVFFHDSSRTDPGAMPRNMRELLDWARKNPGRFTYPQPPDFMGSTFLKQALVELVAANLLAPAPSDDSFTRAVAPVFDYFDRLHPLMWRGARAFPPNYPAMKQLLADGDVEIIFAFNPAEASNAIANGELPDTVRSFTFPGGTIANTHFVAIPYNAAAKAGALVLADFLLSPEAQARKQDPAVWGDPTVLDPERLAEGDRDRFAALDLGVATLAPDQLGPAIDEPHPSWMERLESEWKRRYGVAN